MAGYPWEPIQVPEGFWTRPDVITALRARDIGSLIRLVRQYTGTSQGRIAARIDIDQGRVSEIVNGKRQVESITVLHRIADGLGMPDGARVLLGISPTGQAPSPAVQSADGHPTEQRATRTEPADTETSDAPQQDPLLKSVRESELLLAADPEAVDLDLLQEAVTNLAVAYLTNPPLPMLEQALALRTELVRRAKTGAMRPSQLSDVYVAIGRATGVITYAALDLGDPTAALTNSKATWHMADMAGDRELQAWVRGTQSLIARFNQEYVRAKLYAEDGLQYAGPGTSEARLLCGAAQCAANLGNTAQALRLIEDAEGARERATADTIEGIFGFSPAKQTYYSASSLMWATDQKALKIAARSAEQAIDAWQQEPTERRSLDDEALAHVYLATARLKLGDVDGAMQAVNPVMTLPPERQISWIRKRVANLGVILADGRFHGSKSAATAREKLLHYGA
jgi:transcriptional regulator with XRE-family HTH domain